MGPFSFTPKLGVRELWIKVGEFKGKRERFATVRGLNVSVSLKSSSRWLGAFCCAVTQQGMTLSFYTGE